MALEVLRQIKWFSMVTLKNLISNQGTIFIIWQKDKTVNLTVTAFFCNILLHGVCFTVNPRSNPLVSAYVILQTFNARSDFNLPILLFCTFLWSLLEQFLFWCSFESWLYLRFVPTCLCSTIIICSIIMHVWHLKINTWWIWCLEDTCAVFSLSAIFL